MTPPRPVCGRCGSVRVKSVTGTWFQRVVTLLRGSRLFRCSRCHWVGRIAAAEGARDSRRRSRRSASPVALGPDVTQAELKAVDSLMDDPPA